MALRRSTELADLRSPVRIQEVFNALSTQAEVVTHVPGMRKDRMIQVTMPMWLSG